MPMELQAADKAALESIVKWLEAAWNAMDAKAFAAPFAVDADFVNIRGEHHKGRPAIEAGHAAIFSTIYAGSTNTSAVESVRLVSSDVALVHVRAQLKVPQGPLAGLLKACYSMVLTRNTSGWEIASFHNTLEAAPGGR